jgi:hypothetical protein
MTVDLITGLAIEYWMGSIYNVETLRKGMIHILDGMKWDRIRFHHSIQNSM